MKRLHIKLLLGTALVAAVTLLGPLAVVLVQPTKVDMRGPWDEAVPVLTSKYHHNSTSNVDSPPLPQRQQQQRAEEEAD